MSDFKIPARWKKRRDGSCDLVALATNKPIFHLVLCSDDLYHVNGQPYGKKKQAITAAEEHFGVVITLLGAKPPKLKDNDVLAALYDLAWKIVRANDVNLKQAFAQIHNVLNVTTEKVV